MPLRQVEVKTSLYSFNVVSTFLVATLSVWTSLTPTNLREIAETAAWAAAGFFFGYKVYAGFMYINLGLAVETTRRRSRQRPGRDDLVVRTILTKGDRATLSLGLVEMVVEGATPSRASINEIQISEGTGTRPMNLTPGETTHFERCFDVDSDSPLTVVVTVRGENRGCWRASSVSLPSNGAI